MQAVQQVPVVAITDPWHVPRRVSVEWNRCKGISSLPNNFTYLGRRLQLAKRSNKPAIGPKTGPPDLTTTPLPKKRL